MPRLCRILALGLGCILIVAGVCSGALAQGLDAVTSLSYDGTAESLKKIQAAVKSDALSGNLVALNIYRQTMYGLSDVTGLERAPKTSEIRMDHAKRKAIVPWLAMVREKANKGDKFFISVLGALYFYGEGVNKDKAEGVKLWGKAAAAGYPDANYKMGITYCQGFLGKVESEQGLSFFRKAAEQGHAMAIYNLGCFYKSGKHVKADAKRAFEYWLEAAEKGHATAQRNTGLCYIKGLGTEVNYAKAKKWFQKAADSGDEGGRMLLKEHFSVSHSPRNMNDPGRPVHGHHQ